MKSENKKKLMSSQIQMEERYVEKLFIIRYALLVIIHNLRFICVIFDLNVTSNTNKILYILGYRYPLSFIQYQLSVGYLVLDHKIVLQDDQLLLINLNLTSNKYIV
uniref:Transmembrane protein n=1 Tax=Glossina brevipalpis TaxID=37001 RepID=A0A1A9X1R1_9MUSC